MTSHCASYMGASLVAFNLYKFSKKSYKRDKFHSTSKTIFDRWICVVSQRELIKDVPRAPKRQERGVSKIKGMSHNQKRVLGK